MGGGRRVRWLPVSRPGRSVGENLAVLSESRRCCPEFGRGEESFHIVTIERRCYSFNLATDADGGLPLVWLASPLQWLEEATGEPTLSNSSQGHLRHSHPTIYFIGTNSSSRYLSNRVERMWRRGPNLSVAREFAAGVTVDSSWFPHCNFTQFAN